MKRTKIISIVIALMMVMAFATACSSTPEPAPAPAPAPQEEEKPAEPEEPALSGEVMIAAAASLENAFVEKLIPMFNAENPDVKITGTYDSSGKLQTQIEEGLKANIFFSAAMKQMNALVEGGQILESDVTPLLENEVVLITGIDSSTAVTSFENITDAATIAIGDPASVPAGQYAEEVLTSLGSWDEVNAKASLGTNVTEVLNWVGEGSAEVGVVYATDAASIADKVKVLAVAPAGSLATPVIYPIALTDVVEQTDASKAFIEFLKSQDAIAIFEKFGFKSA